MHMHIRVRAVWKHSCDMDQRVAADPIVSCARLGAAGGILSATERCRQGCCREYAPAALIHSEMKVLCAGLSKTGTSSVTQALKELGINVLHFEEYFGTTSGMRFDDSSKKVTLDLRPFFEDLVHGRLQDPDFESSLASVEGGLSDIPAAYYFEEIAAAFPECKIILTQRKEQEWYASMRNHVQEVERLRWLSWLVPEARKGFAFFDREHSL
eukprot:2130861-Pleurochrysis_carterae.AAC.1